MDLEGTDESSAEVALNFAQQSGVSTLNRQCWNLHNGNLNKTIRKVEARLRRFVHFSDPDTALLIAVWIAGTFSFKTFDYFGYLWITSAEKRCGKTTLLDLLRYLSANTTSRLTNVTPALLFRLAGKSHTLVLDELENLGRANAGAYHEVISALNNGFQKGGTVSRLKKVKTPKGEEFEPEDFDVYCPKAFAGINNVIDTIEDRSFKIVMQRKPLGATEERFRPAALEPYFKKLRHEMETWADAHTSDIANISVQMLDEIEALNNADHRFKDIAEPLCIIAILADCDAVAERTRKYDSELGELLKEPNVLLKELIGQGASATADELGEVALRELKNENALIMPRLGNVLSKMAQSRDGSGGSEPIKRFLPLMLQKLGNAQSGFVASKELRDATDVEGNAIWGFDRGGLPELKSYLEKLEIYPGKDPKNTTRGYKLERKRLEELEATYG